MKTWKHTYIMAVYCVTLTACAVAAPYKPINCDFHDSGDQYRLNVSLGNTPTIRAYFFQGETNTFDATGYTPVFRYAETDSDDAMYTVTGTMYGVYADFVCSAATFPYNVENYYSSVVLLDEDAGEVYSYARGRITVERAPETGSPAAIPTLTAINGSLYGPFTGSFTNWPFLISTNYAGSWVVNTEFYATSELFQAHYNLLSTQKADKVLYDATTVTVAEVYGWGDHSTNGYATTTELNASTNSLWTAITNNDADIASVQSNVTYLNTQTSLWATAYTDSQDNNTSKLAIATWEASAASGITAAETAEWATVSDKLDTDTWTSSVAAAITTVMTSQWGTVTGKLDKTTFETYTATVVTVEADPVWTNAYASGLNLASMTNPVFTKIVIVSNKTIFGSYSTADGDYASVGGGYGNSAAGPNSFVGSGYSNSASGSGSAIVGGNANLADGMYSAVGGGLLNAAGGSYSFVAGGEMNTSSAARTFAAGYRAKATNTGSFVWGDSDSATNKGSMGDDTFNVYAEGGSYFMSGAINGDGSGLTNIPTTGITETDPLWTNAYARGLDLTTMTNAVFESATFSTVLLDVGPANTAPGAGNASDPIVFKSFNGASGYKYSGIKAYYGNYLWGSGNGDNFMFGSTNFGLTPSGSLFAKRYSTVDGGFYAYNSSSNIVSYLDETGIHIGTNDNFILTEAGNITKIGNINLSGNIISNGVAALNLVSSTNYPETDPLWTNAQASGYVVQKSVYAREIQAGRHVFAADTNASATAFTIATTNWDGNAWVSTDGEVSIAASKTGIITNNNVSFQPGLYGIRISCDSATNVMVGTKMGSSEMWTDMGGVTSFYMFAACDSNAANFVLSVRNGTHATYNISQISYARITTGTLAAARGVFASTYAGTSGSRTSTVELLVANIVTGAQYYGNGANITNLTEADPIWTNAQAVGFTMGGPINMGTNTIIGGRIGTGAGITTTNTQSIFLGWYAGHNASANYGLYAGDNAGAASTGAWNYLIGYYAGQGLNGDINYSFGSYAGVDAKGNTNTYIGARAGEDSVTTNAIMLGNYAGKNASGSGLLIAHMHTADPGALWNPTNSMIYGSGNDLKIGAPSGALSLRGTTDVQGILSFGSNYINATRYGLDAGYGSQGESNIYIGIKSGLAARTTNSVFIGYESGSQYLNGQRVYSIGYQAAEASKGEQNYYFGHRAGNNAISSNTLFLGTEAGKAAITTNSVALGNYAGRNGRGSRQMWIHVHTNDPGSSWNPTNSVIYVDGPNTNLHLGEPGGNVYIRGTLTAASITATVTNEADPIWTATQEYYRVYGSTVTQTATGAVIAASGGIVNTVDVQATASTWDAATGTLGLNTNDAAGSGDFMADGTVAMTGDIDAGGYAITNIGGGAGSITGTPLYVESDPVWTAAYAAGLDLSSMTNA
ncbi:MAG: hypothetical protein EOM12_03335, partial [Verrucomicrobiae bacterium]|nr:hypothetical protein [Verrucomicrobiae bacterium]